MQKHYSSTVDINDEEFILAEKHMYYFYKTLDDIDRQLKEFPATGEPADKKLVDELSNNFVEAMDDDFNTAAAYAYLFTTMKNMNSILADKKMDNVEKSNLLKSLKDKTIELYNILSIFEEEPTYFINDLKQKYLKKLGLTLDEIEKQIEERKVAKEQKNYSLADEIRNKLDQEGIVLLDSKNGTSWNIKELQ